MDMPIESTNNSFGNFRIGLFEPEGSVNLTNGVLWYYRLDESGGLRTDDSDNNLHLTEIGTVGSGTGVIGPCASFPGTTGNQLEHSFASQYDLSTTDFTFTGWFTIDDTTTDRMIQYIGTGAQANNQRVLEISYQNIGDNIKIALSDGSVADLATVQLAGSIPTGQFIFYAIRWTASSQLLEARLDSQAFVPFNFSRSPHNPGTQSYVLGANLSQGDPFDGLIDEIGGWDRLLNDNEIDFLYNGGSGDRPQLLTNVTNADGTLVTNVDLTQITT